MRSGFGLVREKGHRAFDYVTGLPKGRQAALSRKAMLAAHRRDMQEHACRWPRDVQQRAVAIARMLKPFRALNVPKVRVGAAQDGGYVMLDDFGRVGTAFSLGIGPNVDWDYDIAERGIEVHQFDHTVDKPPRTHPRFHFHRQEIVPLETPGSETLGTILRFARELGPASNILKMDIENAEWAVLAEASEDDLRKFSQIVCEFHAFEFLHLDWHATFATRALQKLKPIFEVVHVHGNNEAGITYINQKPLPFVLEVTFASRILYDTVPSGDLFPTSLDMPNDERKLDYFLGRFET